MWPFNKKSTVEQLLGYKKIKINGMWFTIKRINPRVDFKADEIPMYFTNKEKPHRQGIAFCHHVPSPLDNAVLGCSNKIALNI